METKKERLSLTRCGVDALELTSNYLADNLKYLIEITGSYFDGICNFNGDETARVNAFKLVANSDKIRAIVNTMGDVIDNICENLDNIIGELYTPEEIKDSFEKAYEEMLEEKKQIDKAFAEINAKIKEDFTSRD